MNEKPTRQKYLDGDSVRCEKCERIIGEWIAKPAGSSVPANYEDLIVGLLLPVGVGFDHRDDTYRLSKRAQQRIARGEPAFRITGERVQPSRSPIVADFRAFARFIELESGAEVLDSEQRGEDTTTYQDVAPLPARIECPRLLCDHVTVVTLDTAQSKQ
jgi:hypothetical protein